jgi:diguanylate cyclase (GGDEF)-like protein
VTPLRGSLGRLEKAREELAKSWLVRLIERASLEEIKSLPTDRIARELPEVITDVLKAAADSDSDPFAMGEEEHERAARLAELRESNITAADLTRDIVALQSVIFEALQAEAPGMESQEFAELAARIAEAVAAVQVVAIETSVGQRSRELESLANTDPLTGLYNLRYLQQALRQLLGVQKRYQHPFAVLLLDVDGLKRVNDAYGHGAGDRLLMQVALAVRRSIRAVDTPARLGGDEFCVLALHQNAAGAEILAQRLAEAVEAEVETPEGGAVGVSIGVVSCPEHGDEPERLLDLADRAMYRAKSGGERVAVGAPDELAEANSS